MGARAEAQSRIGAGDAGALDESRVAVLLGEWQRREIAIARAFVECRGLSREQLEDLYQETVLMLLGRSYISEEHLRNALRKGMKYRALHEHRDTRSHARIHARYARCMEVLARATRWHEEPEEQAIIEEDRLIVAEFMSELNRDERKVFPWAAEGLRYRAIARAQRMDPNAARAALRSYERKREQFQLLYETGRLCGYRATTIRGLQAGETTSEELASRAIAHVARCAACRSEHQTNAKRLRSAFEHQAAGMLAPPVLSHGWLARLFTQTRTFGGRLADGGYHFARLRERAEALLLYNVGGGPLTRAVAVAAVGVATLGATHSLTNHQPTHPEPAAAKAPPALPPADVRSTTAQPKLSGPTALPNQQHQQPRALGHVVQLAHHRPSTAQEPGGFAYLGVPARQPRPSHPAESSQQGGGPFGP
ncbi:MAG: sigma-70 family RNA polymerase sigma factor [Solirubrobacteraceae bacterium]